MGEIAFKKEPKTTDPALYPPYEVGCDQHDISCAHPLSNDLVLKELEALIPLQSSVWQNETQVYRVQTVEDCIFKLSLIYHEYGEETLVSILDGLQKQQLINKELSDELLKTLQELHQNLKKQNTWKTARKIVTYSSSALAIGSSFFMPILPGLALGGLATLSLGAQAFSDLKDPAIKALSLKISENTDRTLDLTINTLFVLAMAGQTIVNLSQPLSILSLITKSLEAGSGLVEKNIEHKKKLIDSHMKERQSEVMLGKETQKRHHETAESKSKEDLSAKRALNTILNNLDDAKRQ